MQRSYNGRVRTTEILDRMNDCMKIREFNKKDFNGIMKISKLLHPTWFDKVAINFSMPIDLRIHKGYVIEDKRKIIGFVTYTSNEGKAEISWIGVHPKIHRKGMGSKLIKKLEANLKKIGVKELRVGTVAESVEYEPYARTRAFYKKIGFSVEKIIKKISEDTGEIFDFAILVKKI